MRILDFFDYTYYWACQYYYRQDKDNARWLAIFLMSGLYCFNIFSLIWAVQLFYIQNFQCNKVAGFVLFIAIVVLNVIRYKTNTYDVLKERWKDEETSRKKRKQIQVLLYVFLSFALFFGLAIYHGSKNNS
jgi:hypothetical protein